jgi:hypothetical protein
MEDFTERTSGRWYPTKEFRELFAVDNLFVTGLIMGATQDWLEWFFGLIDLECAADKASMVELYEAAIEESPMENSYLVSHALAVSAGEGDPNMKYVNQKLETQGFRGPVYTADFEAAYDAISSIAGNMNSTAVGLDLYEDAEDDTDDDYADFIQVPDAADEDEDVDNGPLKEVYEPISCVIFDDDYLWHRKLYETNVFLLSHFIEK